MLLQRCCRFLNMSYVRLAVQHHCFSTDKEDVVKLLKETIQSATVNQLNTANLSWNKLRKPAIRRGKRKKVNRTEVQCYTPVTSSAFSDFSGLDQSLKITMNRQYNSLLPIQEIILPHSLKNRSVLVKSETGSGKTLTYVIPIVNALLLGQLDANNRCIVIAPTKELCSQIHSVFLSMLPKASSVILLGADKSRSEVNQNKQIVFGVPIIITTPAALNKKLKQGVLRLVDTSKLVIDEFDRLFKTDFEDQVSHILTGITRKKHNSASSLQVLITSATMPDEIKSFVKKHVPDIIVVESKDESPVTLEHKWIISPLHRRTESLLHLLNMHSNKKKSCKKCIIFVQRKDIGEDVLEVLRDDGYFVTMINGDMPESKRNVVFREFKDGIYDILVATDLIARGIDIPECELVFQIQPRLDVDMYLHRAGRSARAGRPGTSYVIACDADVNDRDVMKAVREKVHVEVVDATSFLPAKESGVTSVLENSLHHVSRKDELSFSIDIVMSLPLTFYQKLVADLCLRPVSAQQVPGKRIFGLWFGSPVEGWGAKSAIKHYFKSNCLPEPELGMFRHGTRMKSAIDWNRYFSEIREQNREEAQLRYKNYVKSEMGKKRIRQGRFKKRF